MSTVLHRIANIDGPVGQGVCSTHRGQVVAYLKPCPPDSYFAANEQICGEIGRFLGLPVPAGGLAHAGVRGQPPFYASVSFNFGATETPPIDPDALWKAVRPLCAGILVFDAFVANLDRHTANLAFDGRNKATCVFDHSHALFGTVEGKGAGRLTRLKDRLCLNLGKIEDPRENEHCLAPGLEDASDLLIWFDRLETLPNWWIELQVTNSHGLEATDQTAAIDFLLHRRDCLRSLFSQNIGQFPNLNQTAFT